MPRADLILEPGRYAGVPVYTLLEAASRGYIALDHRLLHATVDHPERAIPDLVRFAAENHDADPVDLELTLVDMFRHLRTPEALPFFIELVARNPEDVSDELVEALVALGAAAVDPLLGVLKEMEGRDTGDLLFLLAALRVRDDRVLAVLLRGLAANPLDAVIPLDIYGDPAALPHLKAALARIPDEDVRSRERIQSLIDSLSAPEERLEEASESFNIWELYPDEESPEYGMLPDDDRLAMLQSGSAKLRAGAAASYEGSDLSPEVVSRLLELAQADPDLGVRGSCWEALGTVSDAQNIRTVMLGVLRNPDASREEKCGAAVALARNHENDPVLIQNIEALYEDPRSRAKALKAMGNSLDRRFAAYPPRHLNDPDPEVKTQAILGVGYLNLASEAQRLEAFFDDHDYRLDALFAYALAVPGATSPAFARALLTKIEDAAGGFRADEEKVVKFALDQRLQLRGKSPVFFPGVSG